MYVDILKAVFEQIEDYDVKFNMTAWKRAIKMVKQGKVIGFFPPYYAKERILWTKFSAPLLEENTIIFATETTLKNKKQFPQDFYGMTVCLNRGFGINVMGGEAFVKAVQEGKIKLIEANNNKDCLSRIIRNNADFYINDQLIDISAFPTIKKGMDVKANFAYIGYTLRTENYHFMNDLQEKVNKVINQMKKNGKIDEIIQNYQ
ncbi:MAG: transporter substrate-binding domain-containing protein [gamma proteobacterium symbiont of Taylorina sp.]|nr:transporter substrate-binding domain-containing protein [gamma proteobacterium symbiont of Taylorina sp.]